MDNSIDKLKGQWKAAGSGSQPTKDTVEDIIKQSQHKMKKAINMHVGNIAILSLTLIGLSLFFYYLAPLQDALSHVGITLMLGGLLVRILIEIVSIAKSKKIDMSSSIEKTNRQYLGFHRYRKNIHGSITLGILFVYSVGYYLLMPEFANYFSRIMLIVLIFSYIPVFMIFGFFIRKSIRDEMKCLDELIDERSKIQE
ncbi:MAG: hypothetical protein ABJH05_08500 [Fulvivirga sp.]